MKSNEEFREFIMKTLDRRLYGDSQFQELNDAFLNVYLAIIDILDRFSLIKPLNEDINDVPNIDSLISKYKNALFYCVNRIVELDDLLTASKDPKEDKQIIDKVDNYSKDIYDNYDSIIREVNSETALKINNMIFVYQQLLRFFNNMLLNHSNYKGKLVNVEKPLVLDIYIINGENFLDYISA